MKEQPEPVVRVCLRDRTAKRKDVNDEMRIVTSPVIPVIVWPVRRECMMKEEFRTNSIEYKVCLIVSWQGPSQHCGVDSIILADRLMAI